MLLFLLDHVRLLSILCLAIVAFLRALFVPRDVDRCAWLVFIAAISAPMSAGVNLFLRYLGTVNLPRYDLYAASIDRYLGNPSFVIGQFLIHHVGLAWFVNFAYAGVFEIMILTLASYLWLRPMNEAWLVARTFLMNVCFAVPLYCLIPVSGPIYAFPGFPFAMPGHFTPHPITISAGPNGLPAAPNGIPSVHTSSALLIVWFTWRWKWGRVVGLSFLVLTIVATLGMGEHYVVDLIAAVPYAAIILRFGIGNTVRNATSEFERLRLAIDSWTREPSFSE